MGLTYDFDIVTIADESETENPEAGAQVAGRQVYAVFRDIRTADALRRASPRIRRIFVDAGFSLDSRRTGLECDLYPAEDAEARALILRRLFDNIRNRGVQGQYCGAFDILAFLQHVRRAQPLPRRPVQERPKPAALVDADAKKAARRSIVGRVGFALGLAVILFVVLKYLAAGGATP
ncbi:hypothetical protein SAMN05444279_101232 [Ruegeria intermedia]|uniref:Uncharacterized protein n=1 Tax=Ruegeria intermedia TaxID=996115 RepID=A0A1M4SQN6_9RHOB|nr:hypothetical protein [Ruegeria intermedia]SHE34574.1 hypothetical protein SAMN05444279_101232 [Ruegeria intermedia]